MKNKEIQARFGQLQSDRKIVEQSWELIERFIYPLGGGKFFQPLSNEGEINWRRRNVYDDTAIQGADTLAASIHGSLTSPAVKWFDYTFRDPTLNSNIEAKTWLEDCGRIVWDTLQTSNFNLEISEGYLDLVAFGNSYLTQEPVDDLVWKGMDFNAVPLRQAYFEEDSRGQPRNFYRLLQWKPSQIISKWGEENVPELVRNLAHKAVSQKLDIIFCIFAEPKNADSDTQKVLSKEKRPFQYKYILRDSGEQLGEQGGYYEMPAYAVRWRRTSGSQWGYGPGHLALSTTLTLNELCKLILEAAEKVVDPASLIQQRGLLSDLDLQPGGQTVVKDINNSLRPYESGARFDVSAMQVQDQRDMIRRLFHVDQLELKESPAMSATEVMVRYELMNRLLGPTMGRLQNDLLDPIVRNTFKMLYRAKQLPDAPASVVDAGAVFDVDYVGPLSRAQKSDDVAAVERWLSNISSFAEIYPELRHVPDPKQIALYLADGLNVPTKLMRKEGEINKRIRKDEQAVQQSMDNQQRAEQAQVTQLEQAG